MKLRIDTQFNEQRISDIRAYYNKYHSHEQTRTAFELTCAQEHAINIIGRDYHLSDKELAARMPDMNVNTDDPDDIALALLDDHQYITYIERRYGR